jgi:SepF-like predicted cell division protein (DUF552 family)
MSFISKLFKREKQEPQVEEFTEIPIDVDQNATVTKIMIEKIGALSDTDNIVRKVKAGNIVVAKIKELKETNLDELKQVISKIRIAIASIDGDIAGVGDEWLIITPKIARIHRGSAEGQQAI